MKVSEKDWRKTVVLFHLLGFVGAHRFYVGKAGTGLLFIVASLFVGIGGTLSGFLGKLLFGASSALPMYYLLSVIYLMDLIKLYTGNFTDEDGALVLPPWKVLLYQTLRENAMRAGGHAPVPEATQNTTLPSVSSAPAVVPTKEQATPVEAAKPIKKDGKISLVRTPCDSADVFTLNEYVVLDTEMTGLSDESDKVVEIALLRVRDGSIVDEYCSLVNPDRPIPSRASKIHGIYDRDVVGAPHYGEVGEAVVRFLGDCTLIGHNVKFDLGFMAGLLASVELERDLTWNYVDTVDLARRAYPEMQNHKLQTLIDALGIKTDGAHRARADALATQKLFELCRGKLRPQ